VKLPNALDRRFRLIAFDWDGTAVANRTEDARAVRGPIERLLRSGVVVVVITGTNVHNVDRQLSRAIQGRYKRNLFLATNRGSEVYGFEQVSEPVILWKRSSTPEEDRALTAIADAVRDEIKSRAPALDVRVIYDRLNRRKVDLIPLPEWQDPPKSRLGDLLIAVQTRLEAGGISGGVRAVIDLARAAARSEGLPDARITSDVKHVEIGLTDKADAVSWIVRELARPRNIPTAEMLVGGDEFGPIAGFPGSDARMLSAEIADATFVSVGPEPGGAPAGVLHLGGGPRRFAELLGAQAALHPVTLPATPESDPGWSIVEEGFVLAREHEIESVFAIGNGFIGARASLPEGSALSAPATFVAGVFESLPGSVPGLVRLPDWAELHTAVNGSPIRVDHGHILEHRRVLDLRQGIVWRDWRHRDDAGRVTRVQGMRLASLADRQLLLQSVALTPENYSAALAIEAPALSRSVATRTAAGISVELTWASDVEDPEGRWTSPPPPNGERDRAPERWTLEVDLGKTYRLDRIARVQTSRTDGAAPDVGRRMVSAAPDTVSRAIDAHRAAWRARWEESDVVIDGDSEAQRAVRFAAYHLISAANPEDEHVSIGARGLTGATYKGHIFWDTEIYLLPFFTLTYPEAARALLMYRYHTLPAARARAARYGYRGALYAWESADTGEDVTPPVMIAPTGEVVRLRVAEQEQHISADVAYGVWSYWRATADQRFLVEAGAEILFDTARFWASRAEREEDGRYHIRGVMGPDEYHESVDDDAYTNGMARFNLEIGAEVFTLLAARWPERFAELSGRLRLELDEPAQWLRIGRDLHSGLDDRTGLIEQFQGYFDLEEIDLGAHEPRTVAIDVLLGRERIQRSKIIKQPDVVMLLHLLWDRFPPDVREANFRYYDARTGHGSSLSPPIHAAVAARLGDLDLAMRYFRQTAEIDLSNTTGNAAGGVHVGALGGLWQAIVFGFAGVTIGDDGVRSEPRLAANWRRLRFALQFRGQRIPVDVSGEEESAVVGSMAEAPS
jgi:trehalose/maltose hydrolase-like predicted phosphorylase